VITLGEVAAALGLALRGSGSIALHGLATLADAGPRELSVCASRRHLRALAATKAAAVIVHPRDSDHCPAACLLSDDPRVSLARVTRLFDSRPPPARGIHATAVVAADAELGEDVAIGPNAVVASAARLGDGVVIGAGASIGEGASLGAGTCVHANAVILDGVRIGARCTVHPCAVIGADGFGFARGGAGWEKIHQLGGVIIGDGVELGAGSTIDRGTLGDTVIEDGVIIDDQVHIAHNCRIGARTAIAACSGVAGSTTIGRDCTLAGAVGVSGHLQLCDGVHLAGQARVTRSVTRPGSYASGTALAPTRRWARNAVRFNELDGLQRRVDALERAVRAGDDRE
jgi:UDP-3-O-[3-hydroxymyristoyl] glucosamine N-acyltransferase